MNRVFLDAELRSKLHDLSLPLDLCDESGSVLARLFPELGPARAERSIQRVIVDAELRAKLHGLTLPLELCDESGIVIARVVPVLDESEFERYVPPISAEELERCRNEPGPDYSTAEVIAYLESLP